MPPTRRHDASDRGTPLAPFRLCVFGVALLIVDSIVVDERLALGVSRFTGGRLFCHLHGFCDDAPGNRPGRQRWLVGRT